MPDFLDQSSVFVGSAVRTVFDPRRGDGWSAQRTLRNSYSRQPPVLPQSPPREVLGPTVSSASRRASQVTGFSRKPLTPASPIRFWLPTVTSPVRAKIGT